MNTDKAPNFGFGHCILRPSSYVVVGETLRSFYSFVIIFDACKVTQRRFFFKSYSKYFLFKTSLIIIITLDKFFMPALADGLSLESKRQQV